MGRGNKTRFLRLVKIVFWSDSKKLKPRSTVMWNGNVRREGLKEECEKCEVIESIRVNGGEFIGMQIT